MTTTQPMTASDTPRATVAIRELDRRGRPSGAMTTFVCPTCLDLLLARLGEQRRGRDILDRHGRRTATTSVIRNQPCDYCQPQGVPF